MNDTIIYIDGIVADLSEGTVIACSFQLWDIGDLKVRNTNYTNRFKIPKTETNIGIFEHANSLKTLSLKPYRKLPCKIVINGVEVVPDGSVLLTDSEDSFSVSVFSGTFDFFQVIGDQLITSLDYSAFDAVGAWSKTIADGLRNTTSGLVAPVLQYGVNLRKPAATVFNTLTNNGIELSLPAFYYHTIIDKIITEAGYDYDGSVFTDSKLLNLIVTAGNSTNQANYSSDFYEARNLSASAVGGQSIVNPPAFPGSSVLVQFANVGFNGSKGYYDNVDTYQRDGSQNDNFMLNVYVWLDITVTGGTVTIQLGDGVAGDLIVNSGGTGVYELTVNIESASLGLDPLCVFVYGGGGTPTLTINGGVFRIKASGSPFTQYGITYVNDNLQIYSEVLPEIKKSEFLKDFLVRFGQLVKEKSGVLYFKGIDEIIADKANAVDWTEKRDTSKKEKFVFVDNGLARENIYSYKVEDDLLTDDTSGRGMFTVDSEAIQKDEEEFTSIFSSSQTSGSNVGILSAIVNVWNADSVTNSESDYVNDPGFRLLAVRDKVSTEPSVTWDVTARTAYKVAYFEDPRFGTCSWQSFLDAYYPKYIASVQKIKIPQRYYMLNEIDILNLDLFKLVYDDGDYFLLRKVGDFIAGKSTKVELLKVV